jgi:hypothetical protein
VISLVCVHEHLPDRTLSVLATRGLFRALNWGCRCYVGII